MDVEQGHTASGLPYLRFGTGSRRVVGIALLTPANTPTGGLGVAAMIDRLRFLARDYTVAVVNRRPGLRPGATIEDMAADYAAMIETEVVPPVDVVGVSTGGTVALQLAADRPDLLRRLVVYSSAHRLGDPAKPVMLRIAERARERRWGAVAVEMAAFLWLPLRASGGSSRGRSSGSCRASDGTLGGVSTRPISSSRSRPKTRSTSALDLGISASRPCSSPVAETLRIRRPAFAPLRPGSPARASSSTPARAMPPPAPR
jgi:pimeloyl-ACP methyl ester carboxylesterase